MAVPWRERQPFLTGGAVAPAARGGRSRHAVSAAPGSSVSGQTIRAHRRDANKTVSRCDAFRDRNAVQKTRCKCRSDLPVLRGPSIPIVRLASARSRRSALLRPRYARLTALTAPSANLVRQLSTAQVNGDRIKSAHWFTNLLTTRIGSAIVKSSFAGCASQPPPHRPMWNTRIVGHRSRFVLFSRHTPWLLIRVTIRPRNLQSPPDYAVAQGHSAKSGA